ncbi:MAG: energy transducer TonB [bacterium]
MEGSSKTIKIKKDISFHNFFLGAILLHLMLFVALNIHKVTKLDISKEAFLKFTLIKLPPSPEAESQPKEEITPQKTEIKVEPQKAAIETDVPKAFKEMEEIKPMDAVQVEERDLLRERLGSPIPDNLSERLEDLAPPGGGGEDLPLDRSDGEISAGSGGSSWGAGIGSGRGGDELGGLGKKKGVQRFGYGQIAFKPLISALPDWVEKSNKIIITTVRVWIDAEGKVIKAEIAKSSGYLELDQLAVDSIKNRTFKASDADQTRIALIEIDFTNIR